MGALNAKAMRLRFEIRRQLGDTSLVASELQLLSMKLLATTLLGDVFESPSLSLTTGGLSVVLYHFRPTY